MLKFSSQIAKAQYKDHLVKQPSSSEKVHRKCYKVTENGEALGSNLAVDVGNIRI